MSLEIALQNAISGLQTSKQALQVVSNNIANVNTEGYSRKIIEQTSRIIDGAGYGVEISQIKRSVDEGVLRQLRQEMGLVENLTVKEAFLKQVNSLFGRPTDNDSIVHEISDLGAQFDSLAVSPETEANQFLTVKAAVDVAAKLKAMSDEIQRLRSDANIRIESTIEEFNAKMDLVVSLNVKIVEFVASGISPAELEDQRDQAVNRMSELMDVKYFEKGDGSITVFSASGQTLIDGQAQHLSYSRPSSMAPTLEYTPPDAVNYIAPGQTGYPVGSIPGIFVGEQIAAQDITTGIGNGTLKGLLDMRDDALPSLQAQIDELAEKLKDELNTVHNTGVGHPPVVGLTGDRFVNSNMTLDASGLVRIAAVNEDGELQNDTIFDLSTYATVGALVTAIDGMTNVSASINSTGRLVVSADNNNRIAINELTSEISAAADLEKGFSDFFGLNNFYASSETFARYRSDAVSTSTGAVVTTGGSLQFTTSAINQTVAYNANDSLEDIRDAINANGTLTGAGISAEVVADGDFFRLQINDGEGDEFAIVETGGGSVLSDINPRPDHRGMSNRLTVREDIAGNSYFISRGTLQSSTFNSSLAGITDPTAIIGAANAGTLTFTLLDGTSTTVNYDGATDSLNAIRTAINSNTTLSSNGISAEVVISGTSYSLRIVDAQSDNFWVNDSDTLGVDTSQGVSVGDGAVAAAIASAFNDSVTFLAAPARGGGLSRTDATFSDFAATILSFSAAQTDSVERDRVFQENLTNELFNKNASISSVNMDEELSNMIIYEQAYLAASRMITTTNELFKVLTEMLG